MKEFNLNWHLICINKNQSDKSYRLNTAFQKEQRRKCAALMKPLSEPAFLHQLGRWVDSQSCWRPPVECLATLPATGSSLQHTSPQPL